MVRAGYKQTELGLIPEEWEVVNFLDVLRFLSTASYSRADISVSEECGYIHYGDIHTKFHTYIDLNKQSSGYISKNKVKAYSIIEKGDLIMADASEDYKGVGKAIEVIEVNSNRLFISGLHTFLLRENRENTFALGFKGYLYDNPYIKVQYNSLATGLKVFSLSKSVFKNVQLPLPPLKEQEAIAEALSDTDKWISSLETLIAKKRLIKQGAMQELLTPKEDWEVKTLGDLVQFQTGFPFSSTFFSSNLIGIRLVKNRDLRSDDTIVYYSGKYDNDFVVQNGDLLVGMDGDFEPVLWKKGMALLNQRVGRVSSYGTVSIEYLSFALIEKLKQIEESTGSTTVKHLSHSDVENIALLLPVFNEQERIATILSDMDVEIEQLVVQLEKAKDIKQGMMQELLTGRVRLV